MKKTLILMFVLLLVVVLSGCLPNARKGWSQDIINHETMNIQKIDPVIYKVNKRVLPERMNQLEETAGWQDRMRGRMKAMRDRI